jgi:hypothetical protein
VPHAHEDYTLPPAAGPDPMLPVWPDARAAGIDPDAVTISCCGRSSSIRRPWWPQGRAAGRRPALRPSSGEPPSEKRATAAWLLVIAVDVAWHLTTIAWWTFAALFVVLAPSPAAPSGRQLLAVLAGGCLASGLVILAASRGRHLAWPFFVAIAAAAVTAMP